MFNKKQPLVFDVTTEGNIAIIKIGGRLDSTNVEGVTEKFNSVVDNNSNKVVVDLQELHYISSIWLGEFMTFSRYIDKHSGKLVLINMDKKIKRIFDVLGFSDNIAILNSFEDAKKIME
jgi:anti-anti-sigma factor